MYLHANLYTHAKTFTRLLHVYCMYKSNARRFQVHENIYIQIYKLIYLCMNTYIYAYLHVNICTHARIYTNALQTCAF